MPTSPSKTPPEWGFYIGRAIDDAGFTPIQLRLMLHLRRRAGKNNEARCGIRSMANTCKMGLETVVKAIRELEEMKVIICERRDKATTRYRINDYDGWRPPTTENLLPNPEQIAPNNCSLKPNGLLSKPEQNLLPNPEQNCSDLSNERLSGNPKGLPTKANTRPRAETPKGSSPSPAPVTASPAFELSQEDEEQLNREFPRLRPVRSIIYRAAKKCAEDYPDGGPMKVEYLRRYLEKAESDLDPPGLEEGKRFKAELIEEAARDRKESAPSQPAPEPRIRFTRDGVPIDEKYWAKFSEEIRRKIQNDHEWPSWAGPEPGISEEEPQSEPLPVEVPTPPQITRPVLEQPQTPEELLADSKSKNPEIAQEIDVLYANLNPWDAKRFKKEVGRLWDEHHRLKKAADGDETPEPSVTPNRTDDEQQPDDSTMTGDRVTPVELALTSTETAPVVELCGPPIDTPKADPIATTGEAAFSLAAMLGAANK